MQFLRSIACLSMLACAFLMSGGCSPGLPATNDNTTDNTSDNTTPDNVSNENASSENENENVSESNENESNVNDNETGGNPVVCDPACEDGETCVEGFCTPVDEAEVQFGFTNEDTGEFTPITDGGVMPIFTFGQGGSHMYITVRAAGFEVPEDQTLSVTYILFWQVDGSALSGYEEIIEFSPLGDGVYEAQRRIVFISEFPEVADGTAADLTIIVESLENPEQRIRLEAMVNLELMP